MQVLFFDVWTKGIRNFSRLTPGLDKLGYDYKLFHLGSWDDPDVPTYQKIGDIDCYDIKFYNTNIISSILKKENPDVLLILSLAYVLDRTIVTICKSLGINVIYLSHGQIKDVISAQSLNQVVKGKLASKPIKILLNYVYTNVFISFNPIRVLKTIINFIRKTDKSIYNLYSSEFAVNKALVYFDSEKEMFEKIRKFPLGIVEAVGNPEMDFIINDTIVEKKAFYNDLKLEVNENYLLYLEDGYVQSNIISPKEWEQNITDIYNACVENNLRLVIKLHPRTNAEVFSSFLQEHNIISILDIDLKSLVHYSSFIVSYSSSTIIYGMYLKKHILIPRWGLPTGLVNSYPENVVHYVYSLNEFKKLLTNKIILKESDEYLYNVLGKLDGNSVERILFFIKSVL